MADCTTHARVNEVDGLVMAKGSACQSVSDWLAWRVTSVSISYCAHMAKLSIIILLY